MVAGDIVILRKQIFYDEFIKDGIAGMILATNNTFLTVNYDAIQASIVNYKESKENVVKAILFYTAFKKS